MLNELRKDTIFHQTMSTQRLFVYILAFIASKSSTSSKNLANIPSGLRLCSVCAQDSFQSTGTAASLLTAMTVDDSSTYSSLDGLNDNMSDSLLTSTIDPYAPAGSYNVADEPADISEDPFQTKVSRVLFYNLLYYLIQLQP